MTYTLDASGQTGQGGTPVDLWGANLQDGADTIFIQNFSPVPLIVLVTPTQIGGQPNTKALRAKMAGDSDFVLDTRVVAVDAKVQIVSAYEGATFTAWRGKSS